jgi:hypothetical protein
MVKHDVLLALKKQIRSQRSISIRRYGRLFGKPYLRITSELPVHPARTKNYQGWFLSSAGSCCSNMVDLVAGAGDPSAYANASG